MTQLKKLISIPIHAALLGTLLAVTPPVSTDVPVLSTLEAEPTSAHDPTRNGLPFPKKVCHWEQRRIQVIVGYVDDYGRPSYEALGLRVFPVYAWKSELVEVCEWKLVRDRIPIPHYHLTETQCSWVLKVGGVTLGTFGTSRAAKAAAAALGLSAGTSADIQRLCTEHDVVVYLNVPPV